MADGAKQFRYRGAWWHAPSLLEPIPGPWAGFEIYGQDGTLPRATLSSRNIFINACTPATPASASGDTILHLAPGFG